MSYLKDMRNKNMRITRTILLRKAIELYPDFQGGIGSTDFMPKILNWFYYRFVRKYNLSWCRIAGASRKLPHDWEAKRDKIVQAVYDTQIEKCINQVCVPAIPDSSWVNMDHVPFTIECVGEYSWGEKNSGRRQVGTAGNEKQRLLHSLVLQKMVTSYLYTSFSRVKNQLQVSC